MLRGTSQHVRLKYGSVVFLGSSHLSVQGSRLELHNEIHWIRRCVELNVPNDPGSSESMKGLGLLDMTVDVLIEITSYLEGANLYSFTLSSPVLYGLKKVLSLKLKSSTLAEEGEWKRYLELFRKNLLYIPREVRLHGYNSEVLKLLEVPVEYENGQVKLVSELEKLSLLKGEIGGGEIDLKILREAKKLKELEIDSQWTEKVYYTRENGSMGSIPVLKKNSLVWSQYVRGLTQLKKLKVVVSEVGGLKWLKKLTNLNELTFNRCCRIEDLTPLKKLTNLEKLELDMCYNVKSIYPLHELTSLRSLSLTSWSGDGERQLPQLPTQLVELDLSYNSFTSLKFISRLQLKVLRLSYMEYMREFNLLGLAVTLEELNISSTSVSSLSFLTHLERLKILNLSGCSDAEDRGEVASLPSLKEVNVGFITEKFIDSGIFQREGLKVVIHRDIDLPALKNRNVEVKCDLYGF